MQRAFKYAVVLVQALLLLTQVSAQVCPNNYLGTYFIIQADTTLGNAAQACVDNSLVFAQIPSASIGAALSALLQTCGGTSLHVLGYQGLGLGPNSCLSLGVGSLLSIDTGAPCSTNTGYVLCADLPELGEVIDPNLITSLITVVQSGLTTVLVSVTVSQTIQLTATVESVSIDTATVTVFTSTLNTVTVAVTSTIIATGTVTATSGAATATGPTTITTVSVTESIVIPTLTTITNILDETLTISVFEIVETDPATVTSTVNFTTTQSSIITESETDTLTIIDPTTVQSTVTASITDTLTVTVSTIQTTDASFPTARLAACPCAPDQSGFVLIYNQVPFEQAECACSRIGAELAIVQNKDKWRIKSLQSKCTPDSQAGAWIGNGGGDELCSAIFPNGAILPVACDTQCRPCRVHIRDQIFPMSIRMVSVLSTELSVRSEPVGTNVL